MLTVEGTQVRRLQGPHRLRFISRHHPDSTQDALARELGYVGIEQVPLIFTRDPVSDLSRLGIQPPGEIAVVAPPHVVLALVRAEYTVIEFENSLEARGKNSFGCSG